MNLLNDRCERTGEFFKFERSNRNYPTLLWGDRSQTPGPNSIRLVTRKYAASVTVTEPQQGQWP